MTACPCVHVCVFSRRLLRKQGEDAVKGEREEREQSRPEETGVVFIHLNLHHMQGEEKRGEEGRGREGRKP